jgi:pimeloyl-ACP methyl ester carboxylesterase
MKRLSGLKDLLHDAVEGTTDLVERTQAEALARPARVLERLGLPAGPLRPASQLQQALARPVYGAIRAANRAVRLLGDVALAAAGPALAAREPQAPRWAEVAQGALNGVVGDLLARRQSGLAQQLGLYQDGRPLPVERTALLRALPGAARQVCLFVHGLACTELEWSRGAEQLHGEAGVTFGSLLQRDLGLTPLFLRYNSGLHVSENGALLAALLEQLLAQWPVPLERLVLVGHSMGGLVVRSAAQSGGAAGAGWTRRLSHVICIGSPHLGAPLEKGANVAAALLGALDTSATQVLASLLQARSDGIKDLRYGYTTEAEWLGRDPDALLEDHRLQIPFIDSVTYGFIAACLSRDPQGPLGRLFGDALVRVPSASGRAAEPARHLPFQLGHLAPGMNHVELQSHPEVYAVLRRWLGGADSGAARAGAGAAD